MLTKYHTTAVMISHGNINSSIGQAIAIGIAQAEVYTVCLLYIVTN